MTAQADRVQPAYLQHILLCAMWLRSPSIAPNPVRSRSSPSIDEHYREGPNATFNQLRNTR